MMTIARTFITGDTHGLKDFKHLQDLTSFFEDNLTEKDVVIICGDAALTWFDNCCKNLSTILAYTKLPCTIVIVDGNHENFQTLYEYPQIQKFGGPVYKISNSVFYLQRGYIYTINDQTFFSFGGGFSYDSFSRIEYIDWWEEEMPNKKEMIRGIENLKSVDNKVDYIITHSCGYGDLDKLEDATDIPYMKGKDDPEYFLRTYIDEIKKNTTFKRHFFGHFHEDEILDKCTTAVFRSYWEITNY